MPLMYLLDCSLNVYILIDINYYCKCVSSGSKLDHLFTFLSSITPQITALTYVIRHAKKKFVVSENRGLPAETGSKCHCIKSQIKPFGVHSSILCIELVRFDKKSI